MPEIKWLYHLGDPVGAGLLQQLQMGKTERLDIGCYLRAAPRLWQEKRGLAGILPWRRFYKARAENSVRA